MQQQCFCLVYCGITHILYLCCSSLKHSAKDTSSNAQSRAATTQCNGLNERINWTVKIRLSKPINDNHTDWDQYLEEFAFSIRCQQQKFTKFSSFYLMFKRHPGTSLEVRSSMMFSAVDSETWISSPTYVLPPCPPLPPNSF